MSVPFWMPHASQQGGVYQCDAEHHASSNKNIERNKKENLVIPYIRLSAP